MASQSMIDYSTYVSREAIILKPLYKNVDNQEEYETTYNPPWNYVGNVLYIKSYDRNCRAFQFIDKAGSHDEVLLEYDFEHGFVDIIKEPEEIQIDANAISALL